jgi:outer membrane protein assembly factor BamB
MKLRTFWLVISLPLLLSACGVFDWLGGEKEKPRLPGTRIDVLSDSADIKSDESLADIPVAAPEPKINENWRQAGGGPQGMTGNLQVSGLKNHDRTRIGDGNGWDQPLYSLPVIDSGVVYAMDSKGYITAHDAAHIDTIKWTNKSAVGEDELDLLGGGLAFDNGHLYVTTGRGKVFAINAADGKEIWKQNIGVPLRAAPKAANGKIYALSVDNQLFALDAEKGTQIWSHRGINENAGFLAAISPAISESLVIAPYSSGEIHGLDSTTGQDLWNDSLLKPHHTSATASFSGIGGNPIIKDDVVYVAGSSGFIAAFSLTLGRRIWEQDISSLNTPWIAGDFLYMISTSNQLVCLYRNDGRIKWVKQLQSYEDEKKHKNPYFWRGPVMASGNLLVAGLHGEMLVLSAKDGSTISTIDIPEYIADAPIIADGKLYLLTKDARLHVLY